jgi:cation:H+ antiporter
MAELAEDDDEDDSPGAWTLPLLVLGVAGMVVGGALAVRGAEGLVDVLGVGDSVVGLTLLALATSAEMVALVWVARRRGVSELVVAGTVGAVAYNSTVTLGLAALVSPLGLGRHNVILSVAALTAVLPLVLLTARRSGALPRPVGVALLAVYAVTVVLLLAR